MQIKIYKKVYPSYYPIDSHRVLLIELGKWWAINISKTFAETIWSNPKQPNNLTKNKWFIKKLKDGSIIPNWYGFAYYDFNCDMTVYMPIPINLISAAWQWFKFTVLRKIKINWPRSMTFEFRHTRHEIQQSLHALDRLDARFLEPTGTNYHYDIDIIRTTLERLKG